MLNYLNVILRVTGLSLYILLIKSLEVVGQNFNVILWLLLPSWLLHAAQTALHVLQVTLGYMLMLSVMTYNTWIFLGVIAGAGVGYFVSFPLIHRTAPYSVKD